MRCFFEIRFDGAKNQVFGIKRQFESLARIVSSRPRAFGLAAFILLSIIYVARTWFSTRSDFHAYYTAADRLLQGLSPYVLSDGTPFKYLPIASFFFTPLALLPYKTALVSFVIVILFCTYFIYRKVFRAYGWSAVALLALCLFRFHNQDFSNHQVNSILVLLALTFLDRRETPTLIIAAFSFSILASFKLTPLLLLWPLFWMRKWRELILIGIFLSVLNFIPIFFFENKVFVYRDWWNLLSGTTERPAPTAANVQSIASLLWYWFGPFLGENGFKTVMATLGGLFLAVTAWISKKSKSMESENRILIVTLSFSILFSPLAWKHSYVQLLPLLLIWFEERRMKRLWLFLILTSVLPAAIGIFSKEAADRSYLLVLATAYFSIRTLFEGETVPIRGFQWRSGSDTNLLS